MDRFAALTGRQYRLFDYVGHPEAERVMVIMGSGAETAHETVDWLNCARREGGRAQGPALPAVRRGGLRRARCRRPPEPIAVLDRTKEPGAVGEPLYHGRGHRAPRGARRTGLTALGSRA